MKLWVLVRIGLLSFTAVYSFLAPLDPHRRGAPHWNEVWIVLVGAPLACFFPIALMSLASRPGPVWGAPDWSSNPFTFNEHLRVFHLAGYVLIAVGASSLLRAAVNGHPPFPEGVMVTLAGAEVLLAVFLATVLLKSKVRHGS